MAILSQSYLIALAQFVRDAIDFARDIGDYETALTLAQVLEIAQSPTRVRSEALAVRDATELALSSLPLSAQLEKKPVRCVLLVDNTARPSPTE